MSGAQAAEVRAALGYLSSEDRDLWVRVGMAVKAGLGEAGWPLWQEWSRQSDAYKERDARAVWRSIDPIGGITVGTLYALAREQGWVPEQEPQAVQPSRRERRERARQARVAREQREARAQYAAATAESMIQAAEFLEHPYLASKGFAPGDAPRYGTRKTHGKGLVLDGKLLVPMRDYDTNRVVAVQAIDVLGGKKFQPYGCRASRGVLRMGVGSNQGRAVHRWWYCEGYATGLSLLEALHVMHRRADQVVVCFSAANLGWVARHDPHAITKARAVVADHDWWRCSKGHKWEWPPGRVSAHESGEQYTCPTDGCPGAVAPPPGAKAALSAGHPWWQPPEPGTDANDYSQRQGSRLLGKALRYAVFGALQ